MVKQSIVISCGNCGESASSWLWLNPVHAIVLPEGGFQCPGCGTIFQRRSAGSRLIHNPDGENYFVPARLEMVAVGEKDWSGPPREGQVGAVPAISRKDAL